MRLRYCPGCSSLLQRDNGSRFVTCPEHGKLDVTVREVNVA